MSDRQKSEDERKWQWLGRKGLTFGPELTFADGGVYLLYDGEEVVYVGHANCLRDRVNVHRRRFGGFDAVKVTLVQDVTIRRALEKRLLLKFKPKFNNAFPDPRA